MFFLILLNLAAAMPLLRHAKNSCLLPPCEDGPQPMNVAPMSPMVVQAMTTTAQTSSSCHPVCNWACSSQACEEVCEPLCQAPKCETRCPQMALDGCFETCDEPDCTVICPPSQCSTSNCPQCKTICNPPRCKMTCPEPVCESVCADPKCDWKCHEPEKCPAPQCSLKCERSNGCSMGPASPEMPPNIGAKIVSTGAAKLGSDVATPEVPARLQNLPTEAPGAEPVGGPAAVVTEPAAAAGAVAAPVNPTVSQEVMVRSSGPPVLADPVGIPGGEIPVAPSQLPQ